MFMPSERIGRILAELKQYTRTSSMDLHSIRICENNSGYDEMLKLGESCWRAFEKDGRWGGKNRHFWFAADFIVPECMDQKTIVLEVCTGREGEWDALNPQFLAYVNGKLIQGLDVNHREIVLSTSAKKDEAFTIELHAYSGMQEGLVRLNCRISVVEKDVEKLYYDLEVPYNIAKLLDKEDKRSIDIFHYLTEAVNRVDFRWPFSDCFRQSVEDAGEYMEKEFYEGYCGHEDVIAHCVGHTHIDVAWLWTLAQTREKTARSFSTVLNLMKEYPEYIFMSSQPQLYQYIKEDKPEIYEEIKQRVAEGRWEPEGAMWLEADCNLASGEALVRQLLFGTRFFEKEFGIKSRILWLPDVFGYSAALPQLLKKSGIDYFMTTKISWNEYNKLPYDTFLWKGLDGTELLTYFITTRDVDSTSTSHYTTYNGNLIPKQVMGAWKRYQQKDMNDEVLIAYGFGDGGGGPTKEMLENARRMEKGIPGCPKVKLGNSLDFFKGLDARVRQNKKLPKWVGELYLEYHRGTYTSMARNKKFNRKSELMYQAAELFAVTGSLLSGSAYPREGLNQGWRTILLNQFHDILPGSSIKEVYEDSREQYLEVLKNGQEMICEATGCITGNIGLETESVIVFNPLSFERTDIVSFNLPVGYEHAEIVDSSGSRVPTRLNQNGTMTFLASGVPSAGYKAFEIRKGVFGCEESTQKAFDKVLENKYFRIVFDDAMNIVSLYDRSNCREVLMPGARANVLQAFEDKPHNYDAWDINLYYQEKMWEITDVDSVEVLADSEIQKTVQIGREFGDSFIRQDISIYHDIPRIDFKTTIDWKETQVLLKAAFPVDVHSDKATYEIQYGNVERPTHWNTSWDQARFEVCAHKWADLSEDGYGVSLLNDCKYGHDIKDGVMRLTLLKSAKNPNEDADRELHEFTYSLYPHAGSFKTAGTVRMAYELNCPMTARFEKGHPGSLPSEYSFVRVDQENVIIEAVKKAEDSEDIIIRLYECYNRRSTVKLYFGTEICRVWECNLMESNLCEVEHEDNSFSFEIKPFEIKTYKFTVK